MTSGENFTMPVAPMGYGGGGFGGFGADMGWWILILLFALGGGGWGFGGNNGGFVGADVQRGFDQSAVMNGITGLNAAVTSGFSNAEVAACNRALTDLQAGYGNTQAIVGQLTAMQMAQQQCCCDNRAGLADLKYTIATEACADRSAVSDGVRDIIANQTAGIQTILDRLCDQELQAVRRENDNLRTQLNMANLAASQTAQTSAILADNARQTTALEQYLNPVPIPAYVVANPACCNQNYGYGCGVA